MTNYEREEQKKREIDKWSTYFDGDDRDIALRSGVPDEKEFYITLTRQELDEGNFFDKVVIEVDELTSYKHGTLELILPEAFGGQNETKHQSVSGIVYKQSCGVPKGCRVFFHYLAILNAKMQKPEAGLFIICEGKPYLVLKQAHIYVALIDGQPVAMHPDFAISEAVERQDTEVISAPDGMKFVAKKTTGLILLGDMDLKAKSYEPFLCRIVSLPTKQGMDDHRLEAFEKQVKEGDVTTWRDVREGDLVRCGKSWDIKLDNGIQGYFRDRKLFRTRIANIQEIVC